jgi:branched-chain amino acid transport system substrate-binding protein
MLGTAESGVTIAMAPILQENKIPNITSGQSPGLVAVKSPFLFLNGPTSTTYDETLAKYIVDTKGLKSIAMITNNGGYGKGEHDAFLKALQSRSVTPVDDQVVTADQKEFSAVLTGIRQKNPQVIFVGRRRCSPASSSSRRATSASRRRSPVVRPFGTPVYLDTAGAANAEGTIVSSPYLSNDISDASKKFAAAYKAKFNEEAELHGAKAYDGAQILFTALKNSGEATGEDLAKAIRATRYKGLLGDFAYDDTGGWYLRHHHWADQERKAGQVQLGTAGWSPQAVFGPAATVRTDSVGSRATGSAMQVTLQTFIGG